MLHSQPTFLPMAESGTTSLRQWRGERKLQQAARLKQRQTETWVHSLSSWVTPLPEPPFLQEYKDGHSLRRTNCQAQYMEYILCRHCKLCLSPGYNGWLCCLLARLFFCKTTGHFSTKRWHLTIWLIPLSVGWLGDPHSTSAESFSFPKALLTYPLEHQLLAKDTTSSMQTPEPRQR